MVLLTVCAILLHTACEDPRRPSLLLPLRPTDPSVTTGPPAPTAPPIPPPAPGRIGELSGVVTAGGVPVSGARVTLLGDGYGPAVPAWVMTDEKGAYRISGTQKPEWLVSAAKPGYFTATSYVSIPGRQDFDMENETPVPLGQTVRLTPGQSRCASWGYGGGGGAACQRVVVDVVSAGLLEVRVLAPQFEFIDISLLDPSGSIIFYQSAGPSAAGSVTVQAGSYQIDVVLGPGAGADFELFTVVR